MTIPSSASHPFVRRAKIEAMSVLDQLYAAPAKLSHTLLIGLGIFVALITGVILGIRKKP